MSITMFLSQSLTLSPPFPQVSYLLQNTLLQTKNSMVFCCMRGHTTSVEEDKVLTLTLTLTPLQWRRTRCE